MVGVRLRDLRALGRWFAGLSPRTRVLLSVGLAALIAVLAWAVLNARQEARLVSADPDNTPPALARWGAARGQGVFAAHCAVASSLPGVAMGCSGDGAGEAVSCSIATPHSAASAS